MTIETISDAFGVAKSLHRGRDIYLFAKWDFWCSQLGPERPALPPENRSTPI